MSSSVTSDFREEYEAELASWLQRRFLWYARVIIVLGALTIIGSVIGLVVIVNQTPPPAAELRQESSFSLGRWASITFGGGSEDETVEEIEAEPVERTGELSLLDIPRDQATDEQLLDRWRLRHQFSLINQIVAVTIGSIGPILYVAAYIWVRRRPRPRRDVLKLVTGLIVANGILAYISYVVVFEVVHLRIPEVYDKLSEGATIAKVVGAQGAVTILIAHFFASAFLPWTPRESLRPIAPLFAINVLLVLLYSGGDFLLTLLLVVLTPLSALPGLLVCWWRQRGFRKGFHFKMLKGRYGQMKQEFADARRIHEDLFPAPILDGPIRLDFRYEPMRDIGGDYLFARTTHIPGMQHAMLDVIIIDVTGHGLTAALTVNRLAGEIERQFGARPACEPGEMLAGLNDYLHYSLAQHSVYATALCIRIDPNTDELRWASAGHPPGFIRTIDGRIERIESTTIVLGACRGEDFIPVEEKIRFVPGDTLLAYTDGATEARNADGRMLSIEGFQRYIASVKPDADGGWSTAVLREVSRYRHGPAQDDTLIVEIFRPIDPRIGGSAAR